MTERDAAKRRTGLVRLLDLDIDGTGRLQFLSVAPWVASPILALYCGHLLREGEPATLVAAHGAMAVLLLVAGFVLRLAPRPAVVAWTSRVLVVAVLGLFVASFLHLRGDFSLLWPALVPVGTVFLFGLGEGVAWAVGAQLLFLFVLEQPDLFGAVGDGEQWPTRAATRDFGVGMTVLTIMCAVQELLRRRMRRRLLEQSEALLQSSRLESIGRLTSGVAHDFNNLLMVIIGNLDLVTEDARRSGISVAGLEQARDASHRAAELTGKLLSFARRQPLRPEVIDLGELFENLARVFAGTLGESLTLATGVADAPLACRADRGQLENALLNLALNARDAMPSGGRLTLVAQRYEAAADDARLDRGAYVRISVTDEGPGIAPAVRERVFEPFFTTKELGAGTGLGLSMVEGFVRQSDGDVRIRDAGPSSTGTTIELYLPAAAPETRAARDTAPALRAGRRSSS